jgi:hypothetical protein
MFMRWTPHFSRPKRCPLIVIFSFYSAEDSPKKCSLDFGIRPRKFHGFNPDSQDVALSDLGFILYKLSVWGVDVK